MKAVQVFTLCVLCALAPVMASAASLYFVQRGDIWYVDQLGKNRRAVVRDKVNGKVKILYVDGAVEWVSPSSLLTESQSMASDAAEFGVGVAIGIGVIYCLANPTEC